MYGWGANPQASPCWCPLLPCLLPGLAQPPEPMLQPYHNYPSPPNLPVKIQHHQQSALRRCDKEHKIQSTKLSSKYQEFTSLCVCVWGGVVFNPPNAIQTLSTLSQHLCSHRRPSRPAKLCLLRTQWAGLWLVLRITFYRAERK